VSAQFELEGLRDEHRARAVLVGVDRGGDGWPVEESLAELERLANTAGADVVGRVVQKLEKLNPRTFIGSGKADEVSQLAAGLEAGTVIFDDDLTPRQQANLEDHIPGTRVLDRTALILEIFGLHAESREGKLQVELAKLEYVLPRLRGMWGHLEAERLGGGRGARFGAGESQLEVDRRLTRKRISDLRKELKAVSLARQTQRKQRGRSGVFRVSLVGYTNAGKSTLLNALSDADALAQDMLFATLDSTTRRVQLPEGREITLTDTVGFIHKLPHGLVEAFKSTLDEVAEADLLLHVVDGSHAEAERQMMAVDDVLHEIGADSTPQLIVVNKIDVAEQDDLADLRRRHPGSVFVSARRKQGLEGLADSIGGEATKGAQALTVLIPYTRGDLVQLAHEHTHVVSESHTADGTLLMLQATGDVAARLGEYQVEPEGEE
jgi:GTP-binding protein HflX